jgi:hypothetical protein
MSEFGDGAMNERELMLPLQAGIRLAGDLNELVVSFDRIFSRMAFGTGGPELLVEYMNDRDMQARIAAARELVFDALEVVIGPKAAENGYRHFEWMRARYVI